MSSEPSRTALLLSASRRFALLVVAVAAGTALVSLALGLLFGAGVSRSISLGFYGVGSIILIMGFFAGNRGPARVKGDPGVGLLRGRATRWASGTEQRESINLSFVFVALGALLIVFGVLADTRYSLF
ncbi:MAG: hypothetical protein ACJ74N_02785 [Gaiellaceae bacterium]